MPDIICDAWLKSAGLRDWTPRCFDAAHVRRSVVQAKATVLHARAGAGAPKAAARQRPAFAV